MQQHSPLTTLALTPRGNNRKLDNFRYVLDGKIEELMTERGPVNDHISKLENHIKDMYDELVNEFYEKKHNDRVLANKDLKIEGLIHEVAKLRSENREKDRTIQTICHDLTKAKNLTLASAIQAKFKQMYATYVRAEHTRSFAHLAGSGSGDGATVQEVRLKFQCETDTLPHLCCVKIFYHLITPRLPLSHTRSLAHLLTHPHVSKTPTTKSLIHRVDFSQSCHPNQALRQRRHMERTTATLKHALKVKDSRLQTQTKLTLAQNSLLINECNNLRKENKLIKMSLHKVFIPKSICDYEYIEMGVCCEGLVYMMTRLV